MSTIRYYIGKGSSLKLVSEHTGMPNKIEQRKTVAGYVTFRMAVEIAEEPEITPLTRIVASDGVRDLATVYPYDYRSDKL